MAPKNSPGTGGKPDDPPAWATGFFQEVRSLLDTQAQSLRAEADSRQQQIDAALASVLPPTRSSSPRPVNFSAALPPAPAKAAAGLAILFEAAADTTPGVFETALEAVCGPGEHAALQEAVESGDLAAATRLLQGAKYLRRSAAAHTRWRWRR